MVRKRSLSCIGLLVLVPVLVFSQGYIAGYRNGKSGLDLAGPSFHGHRRAERQHAASPQRAGALRAARMDALRNLLETVKGINLNSETLVENAVVTNDQILTKVEGAVRGFPRGGHRVTCPRATWKWTSRCRSPESSPMPFCLHSQPSAATARLSPPAAPVLKPGCGRGFGAHLDARGLGLRPAMAPGSGRAGQRVYGSKLVRPRIRGGHRHGRI